MSETKTGYLASCKYVLCSGKTNVSEIIEPVLEDGDTINDSALQHAKFFCDRCLRPHKIVLKEDAVDVTLEVVRDEEGEERRRRFQSIGINVGMVALAIFLLQTAFFSDPFFHNLTMFIGFLAADFSLYELFGMSVTFFTSKKVIELYHKYKD